MNLTQQPIQIHGLRRVAITAACTTLGLAACTSALALRKSVTVSIDGASQKAQSQPNVVIDPKDLRFIAGGPLVYPKAAKEEKIGGTVRLHVLSGENGVPEKVTVVQGVRPDLDQAAVDRTQADRFEPYLLNGKPVKVAVDIYVNYVP